ncbi:RstC protein, partial [Vibrio diabolicus]|uniref:RstC protein n=2 Tax=Vibrionaceae TaxID=641 RepID=UPI00211B6DF8
SGELIMTSKEYTLTDVSDSLEGLYDMAVYLNSGSYTEEISEKIIHHLHDKIVDLQGMVNFIRIAPELQESKPQN